MKSFYTIHQTRYTISRTLGAFLFNRVLIGGLAVLSFLWLALGAYGGALLSFFVVWALLVFLYSVLAGFILGRLRDREAKPVIKRNLAEHLSYRLARELLKKGNSPSAADLWEAAARTKRGRFMISTMGIDVEKAVRRYRDYGGEVAVNTTSFFEAAWKLTETLDEQVIDGHVLVFLLLTEFKAGKTLVRKADLAQADVEAMLEWEALRYHNTKEAVGLSPKALSQPHNAVGRFWSFGYTKTLNTITTDLTARFQRQEPYEVVAHSDLLKQSLSVILQAKRNNVMFLGDIGVGKHTLVEHIAARLFRMEVKQNRVPSRVLMLNIPEFLSGTQKPDTFFLKALSEAEAAGNIVLVIDEISVLLKDESARLRQILERFLDSPRVSIVGIDNSSNYHTVMKEHAQFSRSFETINVPETDPETTYQVLMMEAVRVGKRQGITVTYQSLKTVYRFGERYMIQEGFPGKAVDILQKGVQKALSEGTSVLLESHIREAVKDETNIDVTRLGDEDREKLLNLEENLREEIVGQEEALEVITNALKRARVDVRDREAPLGTFLFLGPTGVGKTETAKALARNYFGSQDRMIRLDMNEFSQSESVYSIIGAPVGSGGGSEGYLTQKVQERPFSVILLDELEKAHPKVLNTFLQIFDEGTLTDNRGMQTDFRYTIIIATSNAGALFVRQFFRENKEFQKQEFRSQLIDRIVNEGEFAPEFVNRFTKIVVYYPLKPAEVQTIARHMISNMQTRFQEERGVNLEVTDDAVAFLAEEGHSLDYGARELERTITDYLETYLADYLLLNEVERGDTISVTKEQLMEEKSES